MSADIRFFSLGTQDRVSKKPSVFEPLKLYCMYLLFASKDDEGLLNRGLVVLSKLGVLQERTNTWKKKFFSLTLTAPIMTAADDIHKYFFIVFQRK